MIWDETVGKRIRGLRKKNKMTQLDLCALVITDEYPEGLPKSTLAGYERAFRRIKLDVLVKLTEVLNTSSDYLLGITDDPIPSKPNKDLKVMLRSADYYVNDKKLSNENKELVIQILEKLD